MNTTTQIRHRLSRTHDLCWKCPDRDRPRRQNRRRSTPSRAKEKDRNFKPSNADFLGVISGRRYYSPVLGRWISRDPIGERGGVNLHCFVWNSAIQTFDHLGMVDQKAVLRSKLNWMMLEVGPGIAGVTGFSDYISKLKHVLAHDIHKVKVGNKDRFVPGRDKLTYAKTYGQFLHELAHAYLHYEKGIGATGASGVIQEKMAYTVQDVFYEGLKELGKAEWSLSVAGWFNKHNLLQDPCDRRQFNIMKSGWISGWATLTNGTSWVFNRRLRPDKKGTTDWMEVHLAEGYTGIDISCSRISEYLNSKAAQNGICVRFSCKVGGNMFGYETKKLDSGPCPCMTTIYFTTGVKTPLPAALQ